VDGQRINIRAVLVVGANRYSRNNEGSRSCASRHNPGEVKGAVDGTVWTQVFDHDPHPLCFRNAESYLEIAEAYVGYLTALAARVMIPHAWLSKDNKGQRITQGREWIF
jgi:hypothetical protein